MIGMDVEELPRLLNAAYASEWLAHYQYWPATKLVKGPMKDAVAVELTLHATEELNHATLLVRRILQLGGTPVTDPRQWFRQSSCPYGAPNDPYTAVILDPNIAGEHSAIGAYEQLVDVAKDKDMVTYSLALTILEQEVEHEEDLQSLKEGLDLMVARGSR